MIVSPAWADIANPEAPRTGAIPADLPPPGPRPDTPIVPLLVMGLAVLALARLWWRRSSDRTPRNIRTTSDVRSSGGGDGPDDV
jgi:hypothetical protein